VAHLFAMGGYAAFVWPAYAISILGLGATIIVTVREYRRAQIQLALLETEKKE